MGLALCHSLPRDLPVQVSLLLFFAAVVLQAAAIGLHNRNDGGGYFTVKDTASSQSRVLALLAAHPATYVPPTSTLHSGVGTALEQLCNPSADALTYACARFAESFHIVNGLTLSSFITNVVVVVLGVFVLVRLSHSTLGLLFRLVYAACVPVALQCAAVGCFFARTVHHARRDAAFAAGISASGVKFHRHPAANLMIAATALLGAGLVILFVRWVSVLCLRARFEDRKEHSKEEVKQITAAHMVNDDWTRQKQILLSHARSVQVEMAVKHPGRGDGVSASATARNSEPFPPGPIDTAVDARRVGVNLAEDGSDADTLHFRATSFVTPLTGHGSPSRSGATGAGGGAKPTFDNSDPGHKSTRPGPPSAATEKATAGRGAGKELVMSADDTHPFSDVEVREGRDGGSSTTPNL